MAQAATPQDAYAMHVKLTQLRWTAGVSWPGMYGRHKAVERRADGWSRVLSYIRNSATGELERDSESDPPWSPPGGGPAGNLPHGAEMS